MTGFRMVLIPALVALGAFILVEMVRVAWWDDFKEKYKKQSA